MRLIELRRHKEDGPWKWRAAVRIKRHPGSAWGDFHVYEEGPVEEGYVVLFLRLLPQLPRALYQAYAPRWFQVWCIVRRCRKPS